MESAASGMLVGIETAARLWASPAADFPAETAIGLWLSTYPAGAWATSSL